MIVIYVVIRKQLLVAMVRDCVTDTVYMQY